MGNVITSSEVYFNKTRDNPFVLVNVTGLRNAPPTKPTSTFKFVTYDNYGAVMCENLDAGAITSSPGAIAV